MRLLGTVLVAGTLATVVVVGLGFAGVGLPSPFGPGLRFGGAIGTPFPSQAAPRRPAGGSVFTPGTWVVTRGSSAGYDIQETTVLGTSTLSGRTTTVSGQARLAQTAAAITLSGSTFSADLTKLSSGDPFGDGQVASALQTARYPNAQFEQTAPVQFPSSAALQRGATVTVPGRVTLRGRVRQVSVPAQVTISGGQLLVVGSIPLRLADFGIDVSALGGLVTLGATASLNLSLVLAHQ